MQGKIGKSIIYIKSFSLPNGSKILMSQVSMIASIIAKILYLKDFHNLRNRLNLTCRALIPWNYHQVARSLIIWLGTNLTTYWMKLKITNPNKTSSKTDSTQENPIIRIQLLINQWIGEWINPTWHPTLHPQMLYLGKHHRIKNNYLNIWTQVWWTVILLNSGQLVEFIAGILVTFIIQKLI